MLSVWPLQLLYQVWVVPIVKSAPGGVLYSGDRYCRATMLSFTASLSGLIDLHQRDVGPLRQLNFLTHT